MGSILVSPKTSFFEAPRFRQRAGPTSSRKVTPSGMLRGGSHSFRPAESTRPNEETTLGRHFSPLKKPISGRPRSRDCSGTTGGGRATLLDGARHAAGPIRKSLHGSPLGPTRASREGGILEPPKRAFYRPVCLQAAEEIHLVGDVGNTPALCFFRTESFPGVFLLPQNASLLRPHISPAHDTNGQPTKGTLRGNAWKCSRSFRKSLDGRPLG